MVYGFRQGPAKAIVLPLSSLITRLGQSARGRVAEGDRCERLRGYPPDVQAAALTLKIKASEAVRDYRRKAPPNTNAALNTQCRRTPSPPSAVDLTETVNSPRRQPAARSTISARAASAGTESIVSLCLCHDSRRTWTCRCADQSPKTASWPHSRTHTTNAHRKDESFPAQSRSATQSADPSSVSACVPFRVHSNPDFPTLGSLVYAVTPPRPAARRWRQDRPAAGSDRPTAA